MFLSSLLSLKSFVSVSILLLSVGIGSFLYLTLNDDFEAKPRSKLRSNPLKTGNPIDEINKIINTARQTWSIIDNNRAVVDVKNSYGNMLPSGVTDPFQLESWSSPPASHSFTVTIYNRLKQSVLKFDYSLQYTYGGSFNSKGEYLDRVTIIPSRISVAWGFVFNASVQITSVHNIGTIDQPIAAADIDLHYRLTGLNTVERTESFHVTGKGKFEHTNAF